MRIGHLGRNRGYNDQLLGSRFLRLDLFQMVNLSITEAVCYRSNQEECWFSLLVVISPLVALMADQVVGSRRPSCIRPQILACSTRLRTAPGQCTNACR